MDNVMFDKLLNCWLIVFGIFSSLCMIILTLELILKIKEAL
jgi:hypothetical protein